jgi:hypothetical protein
MGELSPSNLAFASFPLPRAFATGTTLLQKPDEPKMQQPCAAAAAVPPSLTSCLTLKQEDGMNDCDALPASPSRDVGNLTPLGSHEPEESLASLIAGCPPNLHSGIVDAVCR